MKERFLKMVSLVYTNKKPLDKSKGLDANRCVKYINLCKRSKVINKKSGWQWWMN